MKTLMIGITVAAAFVADADTKYWTGSVNQNWDKATQNWRTADGTPAVFKSLDDVVIDDTSSGDTISFANDANAKTVLFDISRNLTLTASGCWYGFYTLVESITKKGAGTLTIKPAWQSSNKSDQCHYCSCDITIDGGTIQSGVGSAWNTFGMTTEPFTITVNDGGRLLFAHSQVTGKVWDDTETEHTIVGGELNVTVKKNGIFEANAPGQGVNGIGWLTLDGGTFRYGNGYNYDRWRLGTVEIHHGMRFKGDVPYVFDYDSTRGGYQDIAIYSTTPGELVEIAVDDVSAGEGADVTFNIGLIKPMTVSGEGFRKTGAGHLVLGCNSTATKTDRLPAFSTAHTIDGDIRVEDGVLELAGAQTLNPDFDRELYISTNAELRVTADRAVMALDECNTGAVRTVVDHGVCKVSGTHAFLGSLTLDHATLDYSGLTGTSWSYGIMTLGKLLKVVSDTPTTFANAGNYPMIHLQDTAIGGTEIWVGETDGSRPWDFLMDIRLEDHFDASVWAGQPGGFVKTGPGTLCLNKSSYLSGDISVREGALMVSSVCERKLATDSDGSQTLLGTFNPAYFAKRGVRYIDTEKDGTLWLNASWITPSYNDITNNPLNVTFRVNGGKLKFTGVNAEASEWNGAMNVLPNLTVCDGGTLEYARGASAYGLFKVAGTFKVTGTEPFTMNRQDPTCQWLNLNGYPATVFEIDDVTGTADADATFDVALTKQTYPDAWSNVKVGFRKIGSGTMRLASPDESVSFDGDATVEAGTLQIDGDIHRANAVLVSAGAYVAGTGTVSTVEIAAGGGMRIAAMAEKPLNVTGDLTLGETGTFVIDGVADGFKRVVFCEVDGTINAPTGLAGWTVSVPGASPDEKYKVRQRGNCLVASKQIGMSVIIR